MRSLLEPVIVTLAVLSLAACSGGGGGGGTDGGTSVPAPTPIAPSANAGADRTVDGETGIQLDGSGSQDGDGRIVSHAWMQLSGPPVVLSGSTTVAPHFTPPPVCSATPLAFRLTVTDDDGLSASDTVVITVEPVLRALSLVSLAFAQTHVLPAAGRQWTQNDRGQDIAAETLHLVGNREARVLVRLSHPQAEQAQIEGRLGSVELGTIALDVPAALPPTESGGETYADDLHSTTLPAGWIRPGLQLRVLACRHTPTDWNADAAVGGDFPMILRVLPFYVFGANEANSGRPLGLTGAPDAAARSEMYAKWPVASLDAGNHPAGKVEWPVLVIPPRGGNAAYVARSTSDYRDGFDGMSAQLSILGALKTANGEGPLPVQYYAPLLALDAGGTYRGPGGGLGSVGGGTGVGDETYAGIFIHEQGHAFGLPHAGEAYDALAFPYEWGSLKGSAWGYDAVRGEFLAPFLPTSSSRYGGCASQTFGGRNRARDAQNRCVKQDPMQSGAGDQAVGYRYATFSDYGTAVMQRWFEGRTTVDAGGVRRYSGGRLVRDPAFPGGYKRWDTLDRRWVNVDDSTTQGGIFGLNKGLPLQTGVPVQAIVVTLSHAGTDGVTQIYPPLRFVGNLMDGIDPTDADDRARIVPDTGELFWYCRDGGCDYTLRITYAGLTQRHVLLQGGFRPFNQARGTPPASASNPVHGDSFRRFVVNVPDDDDILRIELLSTPMAWEGISPTPTVLAAH